MTDFVVVQVELLSAAATWDEQADQLRGAVASIGEVDAAAVGPRAAAALALFRDHWSDRLGAMQAEAAGHAGSLRDVAGLAFGVDAAAAEAVSGLVPRQG